MHELTVCIPTLDGSDTIQKAIKGLIPQGLDLKIIIMDNGSKDGTPEMIRKSIENKFYGNLDIELHEAGEIEGGRPKNIAFIRKRLASKVDTKYMFWLDDDVKVPPYSLKMMLDMMQQNPKLGCMAIQYQPFNGNHVAIGATMMQSSVAKELTWSYLKGDPCECRGAFQEIKAKGLEVMYMRKITALDLNYL